MYDDYLSSYQKITQNFQTPDYEYVGPEEQGNTIRKCSILEATSIGYSNETKQLEN